MNDSLTMMVRITLLLSVFSLCTGCAEWERERAAREAQQQQHELQIERERMATQQAIERENAIQRRNASIERTRILRPVAATAVIGGIIAAFWWAFLAFRAFVLQKKTEIVVSAMPYLSQDDRQRCVDRALRGPNGPALLEYLE